MKIWVCAIITLPIVIGIGCSSTKHVVHERTLAVNDVVNKVFLRDQQIKTLKGGGSITVESPEASNSGSFDVDLRKPDSLRVEFSGPFGIHIGTLMMSPQQYIFYNARENIATVGKPDGKTLQSMFRITLQFDEILRAFTGEFLSSIAQDSLEQFSLIDDLYVIRYRANGGIKEYRVDPDLFVVTSYRFLNAEGKPNAIAIASRFDDDLVVVMPRLVRIIIPQERRSVTIAYGDLKVNEPVECSFTLPKQAEVHYR